METAREWVVDWVDAVLKRDVERGDTWRDATEI
jgi:hypothetical protein